VYLAETAGLPDMVYQQSTKLPFPDSPFTTLCFAIFANVINKIIALAT
jgi:hypothetical protein